MTLWHGRLGRDTADVVMAFTVQPATSTAAGPRRPRRVRVPMCGASDGRGLLDDAEVAVLLAALDQVEEELNVGRRSSSRPATRTSTPRSSGGSPRSPATSGAKLHTGRSRNDQVATDLRLYAERELRALALGGHRAPGRAAAAGPGGRRRLPARLHPPAAGPAGAARPSSAGPRLGPLPGRRPPAGHGRATRRLPAGCRRAGRLLAAARSRRGGRRPRVPRRASRTRSTPCPTATSSPRRSSTSPCWASTCRAWARSWCCGPPRSSASPSSTTRSPPAARCCPRRRTPTWPSWPAARPDGSSAI